jgi:transcription antitermination factor NusG
MAVKTAPMGLTERELCSRETGPKWYALAVKHQHERRTEEALRLKEVETLVPLYRARNRWSDRLKEIHLPLFAGYVFCRFVPAERIGLLNTPGVRNIVGFGGKPAAIEDREIAAIQAVARSTLSAQPWPYLKAGDRVLVERGPLRGLEGTLLKEPDSVRLVISVELLQRSIAVEVEPDTIVPARIVGGRG